VFGDDLGGAVGAAVEGGVEMGLGTAAHGAVGRERAVDPVLLVVGRNHYVETQANLLVLID
jgi:hypothetical protein